MKKAINQFFPIIVYVKWTFLLKLPSMNYSLAKGIFAVFIFYSKTKKLAHRFEESSLLPGGVK